MSRERPWTVLPHKPLDKLEDNLWSVEGQSPVPLPRRAMFVRLSSGKLVIMNAVPLDEPAQKEIEAWGEPAFLVVPNGFHRLDLAAYKRRYPALRVLTVPEQRKKVAERVTVDGDLDALPAGEGLRAVKLAGTKTGETVFVVDSGARKSLLIPGDAIFNAPHAGGVLGAVFKLLGSTGGPRVTPIARMFVVKDVHQLAASFRELASLPGLARVVVCHGGIIDRDPAGTLTAIADRLEGKAKAWPHS